MKVPAAAVRVEDRSTVEDRLPRTPVAKFVVCSWHEQLPDVVGMRPQQTTTSVRQKMTVISKIRRSSTSERMIHEPGDLERDSLTNKGKVNLDLYSVLS